MKKLTLIRFGVAPDSRVSEILMHVAVINSDPKLLALPGMFMSVFNTEYAINDVKSMIAKTGHDFILIDTTIENSTFAISGQNEFINLITSDANNIIKTEESDETKELRLRQIVLAKGPNAITQEEHKFLQSRLA